MTPKEQEIAIGELEERVDRLRNIYEQYFLGFEKLEPTVPRKDVDRRLALLRKEQIRNTAMRFRFQVVTQKYNTYAMHWVRICRQIEEGTYKRHVRKAKARFGDTARGPEQDISIDIDLDDFDSMDMDDVLAEADAAADGYEREPADTVPPAAPAPEPRTPPPSVRSIPDRTARGAALPAGARPLILRKRDGGDPAAPPPPSQRAVPAAPPPTSQRAVPAAAQPPSQQRIVPGAPRAAPNLRPMPASSPRVVRSPQAGAPSAGTAGAPAAGRIPVAAPATGASAGRLPVAPPAAPAAASSAGRIPVAVGPPSTPNVPVGRPAPAGSAGRIVVPGTPAAHPEATRQAPSNPGAKVAAPPSVPKLPPTSMPRPVPMHAPARAPGDAATPPDPRPHAPVPPPGQATRPTPKD